MNIQTLAGTAALACFGTISGLLLADLSGIEVIPALSPEVNTTAQATSLPPALKDLIEGRAPRAELDGSTAREPAGEAVLALKTERDDPRATSQPLSSWERLQPGIDRRFAAMADAERHANIAFVHFLVRNGLEPDSLADETLAGAFDELAELLGRRDMELRTIQYVDLGTGTPEQVTGEDVDDRSYEVMIRYKTLEAELGRRFGGTDQRSDSSAASSR